MTPNITSDMTSDKTCNKGSEMTSRHKSDMKSGKIFNIFQTIAHKFDFLNFRTCPPVSENKLDLSSDFRGHQVNP